MLKFFACFGCEQKTYTVVSPTHDLNPAKNSTESDKPTHKRKISQQSYIGSDANATMASTADTYSKRSVQYESQVLEFARRLQSLGLKQRKEVEYEFVKKNCFSKGPRYAIEKPWSAEYTDFLTKNNKPTLRKIDNSRILSNGRIISGLQSSKDYFVVSKKVWILLSQLYGGGPEVEKNKMLPVKQLPPFGLQNNRYSCYLNSGLQAILSIPEFVDYFYHGYFKSEKHSTKYPLKPLSVLTHQMVSFIAKSPTTDIFSLDNLKLFIQNKFPSVYQHDCQEFIRFYVSRLQQELNPKMKIEDSKLTPEEMLEEYEQSHASIVDILFHGQLNSHTKCAKCENISIAYDPIMELTLEMSSSSLEESIKQYFSPERLVDFYECERCLKRSKATRQFFLGKAPLYLMITIKRFLDNQKKNCEELVYPTALNLENYFKVPPASEVKYSLQSAIIHVGETHRGHYYLHTQRQGKWYQISDGKVKRISIEANLQTEAYILVYRRVG